MATENNLLSGQEEESGHWAKENMEKYIKMLNIKSEEQFPTGERKMDCRHGFFYEAKFL